MASQGYATPLAGIGGNLSGGRTTNCHCTNNLSNPQLLVMDEATSALDYSTSVNYLNLQKWAERRVFSFIVLYVVVI